MIVKQYKNQMNISKNILNKYNMKNICYYDIETTGFDKENNSIVLISMGYFINETEFIIKQYFAENLEEEKNILLEFKKDIEKFEKWCSYNGIAFDEPFILTKMDRYLIDFKVPNCHIDLYRIIRPYYQQLGMNRCNLKTVEKFIGIHRKDEINGGDSVEMYYQFLCSREETIRDLILLHNYEDVLDLPYIFNLVDRIDTDENLNRDNLITIKQLKYLKYLLHKNNISTNYNLVRMKKKQACKIINMLITNKIDKKYIYDILNNIY